MGPKQDTPDKPVFPLHNTTPLPPSNFISSHQTQGGLEVSTKENFGSVEEGFFRKKIES